MKSKTSDTPRSDHDARTEVVSFSGSPLGTGTLAFEPGFSLDTAYAGAPPAFEEGSTFGVYVVGPCIGEGGMARVYRAEHAGLKRHVALKVMTQGFARDSEGRERFLREARIAAAIKHPNVVNIFDVGVCQGIPYLVMELLEGEDLEKVLLSKGALDEGTIIDLVVPVVAGLVAVHDAGIVHRDLKPGNIFLAHGRNEEIEPKLLDFGISKASGKDHLKLTAANGSLMGTPFYMAPEAVQGAEMTPLSDQYSLAVVLRECATGKNPFEGSNFAEVVGLITNARYASLAESNPRLSKRFVAIIERSMSLDPRNRFEDMRAMGRQLLLLAGQRTRITWGLTFGPGGRATALAVSDRLVPPHSPAEMAPLRPATNKKAAWAVLAVVAILTSIVSSVFLSSSRIVSGDGDKNARLASSQPNVDVEPLRPSATALPQPYVADNADPVRPSEQVNAPPPASADSPKADADPSRARADEASVHEEAVTTKTKASRNAARADRKRVAARRRPTPAVVDDSDQSPEWDIKLSTKVNVSKPSFDVGSNNAPILD